jgi:FkbM family methyltransferase
MGIGSAVWSFEESGEAVFIAQIGAWSASLPGDAVVCVDVGANHGGYATRLVEAIGPRAIVHGFEPASSTFEQLRVAVAGQPQIVLHQAAVGAADGELVLHVVPGHSQLSSTLGFDDRSDAVAERVPVRALDGWAAEQGIDRIALLKVDVEGAEADVLRGASGLLDAGAIDVVQFEFGGRNLLAGSSLRTFFDLLEGYDLHRLVTDGLRPLGQHHPALELPISATNYVAVRRGVRLS